MSSYPPTGGQRLLVDTSAYFAFVDGQDINHATARAIATRLATEHGRLYTTNFILAETHALLVARLGRDIALRVLQEIDRGSTTIIRVSSTDELRAREILIQYRDKDFSLTDAISFTVMERLHIRSAFTFDRHFAQYGYTILTPS
ncbi:MAG: type II toxin-antitoxin system VapC family toxin [Chloroflexi bacterium]|nr:type II toxin-antitoxin system VapC family toxin [Chloroflexota bacterium]